MTIQSRKLGQLFPTATVQVNIGKRQALYTISDLQSLEEVMCKKCEIQNLIISNNNMVL